MVGSWTWSRPSRWPGPSPSVLPPGHLAEEHHSASGQPEGKRTPARSRVRESLAAAVAEISHDAGPEPLRELLAALRPRGTNWLLHRSTHRGRGAAGLVVARDAKDQRDLIDAWTTSAQRRRKRGRGAPRVPRAGELIWRTSTAAGQEQMEPIDEVRTVDDGRRRRLPGRPGRFCVTGAGPGRGRGTASRGSRRRTFLRFGPAGWVPTGTATRS